jgi:L-threonylcarbamoyladenylate synthase
MMVKDVETIEKLVLKTSEIGYKLIKEFLPGALTLVFKSSDKTALDSETIGIRIPDNKICLKLLEMCNVPIVTTSANISGEPVIINAPMIVEKFRDSLDCVIDGGESVSQVPSTVIDLSGDEPKVLRVGRISIEEINSRLGILLK